MFNMGSAPSLSDIAAVTKDGNGDGWGGQGRNEESCATIFMSRSLSGALLIKVLIHELGHCALVSYGLLDDIHKVVKPEYWILAEEWVCNFIADYGAKIFSIAYSVLGNDAWMFIPYELDKVIA